MSDYENSLLIINKYKGDDKELNELLTKVKTKINEEKALMESNKYYFNNLDYETYPSLKKFMYWLDENEVFYPKMEIKYFTKENRGVIAKSKIFVKKN
jgi:hypothetical protein